MPLLCDGAALFRAMQDRRGAAVLRWVFPDLQTSAPFKPTDTGMLRARTPSRHFVLLQLRKKVTRLILVLMHLLAEWEKTSAEKLCSISRSWEEGTHIPWFARNTKSC